MSPHERKVLRAHQATLTSLSLSGRHLLLDQVMDVTRCLPRLMSLRLHGCNLRTEDAAALRSAFPSVTFDFGEAAAKKLSVVIGGVDARLDDAAASPPCSVDEEGKGGAGRSVSRTGAADDNSGSSGEGGGSSGGGADDSGSEEGDAEGEEEEAAREREELVED